MTYHLETQIDTLLDLALQDPEISRELTFLQITKEICKEEILSSEKDLILPSLGLIEEYNKTEE